MKQLCHMYKTFYFFTYHAFRMGYI